MRLGLAPTLPISRHVAPRNAQYKPGGPPELTRAESPDVGLTVNGISLAYVSFISAQAWLALTMLDFVVYPSAKLQDGLHPSTGSTIGLTGHHRLAIWTLTLCVPALLTAILSLRLGNEVINRLLTLWGCPGPELAYLYVFLYAYMILLGLIACE